MSIRIALHHRTAYEYDRLVTLSPQVVRLRPAPHCRTPVVSYSLKVEPTQHFLNWQQDPHGNFLARLVFPKPTRKFVIEVDLVAELTVINPFDFFLEPEVVDFPFTYADWLAVELQPFRKTPPPGPLMTEFLKTLPRKSTRTVDHLVELNQHVHDFVRYVIRLEPGVQSCEETLEKRSGSCRDSAWLLVQMLRHLGLAARFVSGYLIQLKPDVKPLDGPAGADSDFTDLHAWTEVYLPGAGWIGLDPTSGLLAAEGHLPLAATPDPFSAAPISGAIDPCETKFDFQMSLTRVHEDPRVTKPYTEEQWQTIEQLGHRVDEQLRRADTRLTMGGEPTFVSIDDMDGAEWNTAALGPHKRKLAGELFTRLAGRYATGPLMHYGQGKWYPGESLPRWALACYWRLDGVPIWRDPTLIAEDDRQYGYTEADAKRFIEALAERLRVGGQHAIPGYEDAWYYMWKERRLPSNVDPIKSNLRDAEERARLAKVFEQGLNRVTGYALPLRPKAGWQDHVEWESGPWFIRNETMYLVPGDSPMGLRLPLDSLPWAAPETIPAQHERDPFEARGPLPSYHGVTGRGREQPSSSLAAVRAAVAAQQRQLVHQIAGLAPEENPFSATNWSGLDASLNAGETLDPSPLGSYESLLAGDSPLARQSAGKSGATSADGGAAGSGTSGNGESATGDSDGGSSANGRSASSASTSDSRATVTPVGRNGKHRPAVAEELPWAARIVRTALCVEAREGRIHIFMPPVERIEEYLALVATIEQTAAALKMPVRIEGYTPPYDYRVQNFKVTPDPGVIEVNTQPAGSWDELVTNTTILYDEARQSRLGTEKFMLDGRHTGTGGGNHLVLGGAKPIDSPFLRRPDLLRSLVSYWNNRPSLSYLFSGLFIGPTSQAPRVDEARHESLYELAIAFQQLPTDGVNRPWLVDRVLRHLLVDLTGNTHRAEFCIDKLFSPDSSTGRLGLVEFRAFEMPPHARMSLTQQLLLRALVARFWHKPYTEPLVRWGTSLHDRFLLPHFVAQDFAEVLAELRDSGFHFEDDWFAPHFEFRFPRIGQVVHQGVQVELRQAIEPWHVLGEEATGGGTARFVDSSLERVQLKVSGLTDRRFVVACNRRRVPLHPTGTPGEYIAGVRFRAWQPPSCLHPTIGVHTPLVFDVIDSWNKRSIGGCTWHVSHPGGRSFERFPVNAYEAESRRIARFFPIGHTAGPQPVPVEEHNCDYPFTLDLRTPIASAMLDDRLGL